MSNRKMAILLPLLLAGAVGIVLTLHSAWNGEWGHFVVYALATVLTQKAIACADDSLY